MSTHEDLIARYEQGVALVQDAVSGIPEALLDRQPAPGKWSIRQLVAHLADAELVAATRFRWVAAEPGSALTAWDQDKWAGTLGYAAQSPAEAVQLMALVRRSTAAMLRSLPEAAWQQQGVHQERGPLTLQQIVEGMVGHLEQHASQIRALRTKFTAN